MELLAFFDALDLHCNFLLPVYGVRCACVLAYPCLILLHLVCAYDAEANSVRSCHILPSSNPNERRHFRHMIKYKYIPFDFGRKTRYGNARAI